MDWPCSGAAGLGTRSPARELCRRVRAAWGVAVVAQLIEGRAQEATSAPTRGSTPEVDARSGGHELAQEFPQQHALQARLAQQLQARSWPQDGPTRR